MSDDSEYDLQARIPGTLQHEFILEGTSSSSSFYPRETLKLANALLLRDAVPRASHDQEHMLRQGLAALLDTQQSLAALRLPACLDVVHARIDLRLQHAPHFRTPEMRYSAL